MSEVKVHVLDGDYAVFDHRLGIAGVKGFAGGFERAMLQAFGEPAIKAFVQEAVNEGLKLEAALAQLDIEKRIVLMHYAPILGTVGGEDPAIQAFLGTTRLLSPCEAFGARAVLHGHAHHGSLQGATPKGIPVYNVSMPVLRRHFGDKRFRVIEILGWPAGVGRFSASAAADRPPCARDPGSRPCPPTSGCSPGRPGARPPTRSRRRTGSGWGRRRSWRRRACAP